MEQSSTLLLTPLQALNDADIPDQLQLNASAAQHQAGQQGAVQHALQQETYQQRQGIIVGNTRLMIQYEEGSELTAVPPVCHVPQAPAWFLGVCNLHGDIVPLVDLARWMGAPEETPDKPMMLVLSRGADALGTVIHQLPQRLRFIASQAAGQTEMAPEALRPHVRGTYVIDGQMWFDVQCASLIDALEESLAR